MPWEELTRGGVELSFTEPQLRLWLAGLGERPVAVTLLVPAACRSLSATVTPLPAPSLAPALKAV